MRGSRHHASLLTSAVALSLTLAACSSASPARTAGGAAAAPHAGGHLTLALGSDPICVDPHQAATNDAVYAARGLVDSLTDQDPATGKIVPWLASSWDVSPDASAFTFHLRDGLTFSNGAPVDARSVKDNFDAVVKLGARSIFGSGYLSGYRGTEVLDAHTAEVTFDHPNAQFLQATSTTTLGLLAPASLQRSAQSLCTGPLIGSGPFTLDSYTPGRSVELSRRADYKGGSALWRHTGPAYLDKITFTVVPESGVRTGSLESGQVDAISGVAPQDEAGIAGQGEKLLSRPNPGVPVALSANAARPESGDIAVRRALEIAVDRKEVVDTVLSGSYRPATSSLSSTTDDYRDNAKLLAYDPAAAGRILDAAGWTTGPDGIRAKNGVRLDLKVILAPNFGPNQSVLELIQQQLKKAGIGLTLKVLTIADYQLAQKSGDYDLAWGNGTRADPDILRTAFSSKLLNLSRIQDPGLESLLDAQAAAADPAKRAAVVAAAQRRVLEQAYQIPVFEMTSVFALSSRVHGVTLGSSSQAQFHDAWLS
ncbi:peptide/nickel transport system substrate-binding protein [Streptomyces sp. DvalAA-14]|uniref:ABC transporter substrate-binding protein n=1 Tax=unclassified Streptomyces TaxID=2593676 RepID=UPI00081B9911|nr:MULTISPECIES: ABC transporter substrate-binding protein [unclassified Streptomyces]MYS19309.1 ABC transporter substrate-binding protein [Streptomyces sp. SID4948]SCD41633.1 peptide/nickel transport system substrate-binding protein [Streptomyces sp. DvalAA-14]